MTSISFEGVRVERDGRVLLDAPSLAIARGRITTLLGANGAGKTTLLRLIAGLDDPTHGALSRPDARDCAFAFQQAAFFRMSLRENLELPLRLRGVAPAERRTRVDRWAGALGVGSLLARDPATLSGGERQRASLARALAVEAPLLLLDEPLGALDERARLSLLDELPGLLRSRAATCVIVTHRLEEALALSDDLVLLDVGRIRAAGPVATVLAAPPDAEAALLLGYLVVHGDDGVTLAIPPSSVAVDSPSPHSFPAIVLQVTEWEGHREALIRPRRGAGVRRLSWPRATPLPLAGSEISASATVAIRLAQ